MAKFSNKTVVILIIKLVLVLSLLVMMISPSESRGIPDTFGRRKGVPECDQVYGAKAGDTCEEVAKGFQLSIEFFSAINPNLNCTRIFIGQWLCVAGSVS